MWEGKWHIIWMDGWGERCHQRACSIAPFHTLTWLLPPSPPLSQACTIEVKLYCKDVPEGEARVIRCLQENKYQKDFGKECKEKVCGGGDGRGGEGG